jgi:hypothetical protein
MKYLMIAAAAVLVLTGCHTNEYQGSPGEDRYMESNNDRAYESRPGENMRSFGRYGSPTSPILSGPGNGSGNF